MKEQKKSSKKWVFILFILMVLAMFYKTNQWANKGGKSRDSTAVAVAPQMSNAYYLQVDQRDAAENGIAEARVYTLKGRSAKGEILYVNVEHSIVPPLTITKTIKFRPETLRGELIETTEKLVKLVGSDNVSLKTVPMLLTHQDGETYNGMFMYRDKTTIHFTLTPKTW